MDEGRFMERLKLNVKLIGKVQQPPTGRCSFVSDAAVISGVKRQRQGRLDTCECALLKVEWSPFEVRLGHHGEVRG